MKGTRIVTLLLLLQLSGALYSQEVIKAEKEHIVSIPLGRSKGEIEYISNEEGFFSAGSPLVDSQGRIIFGDVNNETSKLIISQKTIKEIDEEKGKISIIGTPAASQGGIGIASGNQYLIKKDMGIVTIDYHKYHSFFDWGENYPMPFGALIYSEESGSGLAVIFDVTYPSEDFTLVGEDELKEWLPKQPGGFSIGDDGLLYRNGMVWSAVKKPVYDKYEYQYRGRLLSGHIIWSGGGDLNSPGMFLITDTDSTVEAVVDLPWRKAVENEWYEYTYGIGPWGEIYFLLPPPFVPVGKGKSGDGIKYDIFGPDPSKSAELVVVRNYLKYFGRLNDGGVRLRKGPSAADDILGTYPVKTGFRILEKGTAEETIDGKKSVWYKVRLLDGTEGWFFGAYVQNLYDGPDGNPPPWPNVADW